MLPLYLAMATALGFVDHRVRPFPETAWTKYVPAVLHHEEPAPAKYRVLGPIVYDKLLHATGLRPDTAWLFFRWLCLLGAFLAGHLLYSTWFSSRGAVAGNAVLGAVLPLTFTVSWGHPDHLLELFLFTLGCACVARRWTTAFLGVLVVATLNRETAFLLVVVFAVAEGLTVGRLRWIGAAALVWLATYAGLRWRLGYSGYNPLHFWENLWFLQTWPEFAKDRDIYYRFYGWFFVLLLGAPIVAIVRTWAAQPRFVRGAAGVAVPLFVTIGFLFSSVMEPRIFTPLLPLLATGMLFALFEPESRHKTT